MIYREMGSTNRKDKTGGKGGHLSQPEIIDLIDLLKPTKIIPVHTTHPEIFNQLFGPKIREANPGQKIRL